MTVCAVMCNMFMWGCVKVTLYCEGCMRVSGGPGLVKLLIAACLKGFVSSHFMSVKEFQQGQPFR